MILRFVVLVVGLKSGVDFFWVIAARRSVQVGLGLGPALWVMVRELGHTPHFRGARWADYKMLGHISFYIALIQISVVLADKLDTTILGFMLATAGPEPAIGLQRGEQAVLAAPPDRLDAGLHGDAGGRQPGGRQATTRAGAGQVRRHPAAHRRCSCRWGCWPGFTPVRSCRSGSATGWIAM